MTLNPKAIQELKQIMLRDYGVHLVDQEAQELGASLLRVSKLASVALARADENNSSPQARGRHPLGAKTSVQECTPLQALGEPIRGL